MKTQFCLVLSLFLVIIVTGCTPEEGFYEKEFLEAIVKANRTNYCEVDTSKNTDPAATCEAQSGCQVLHDADLNYLSCVPVLSPTTDSVGNGEGSGGSGGTTDSGVVLEDEFEDEENPGQEFSYICGEADQKVLVCHLPSGDSNKARTLCVARQGWEHGLSTQEGNRLGACNTNDF
ncbi:MAG: hypothetical protein A2X86_14705 [Bdellovibrionales bacterium GWA2_49_15]|nr:MAG: hypothetical protein A2X86_14705 [Bdellovibrionales bacterium GWA2_49_15]HAZ13409.1 hypothetical protein [Bdellovibrionales bacterium]